MAKAAMQNAFLMHFAANPIFLANVHTSVLNRA